MWDQRRKRSILSSRQLEVGGTGDTGADRSITSGGSQTSLHALQAQVQGFHESAAYRGNPLTEAYLRRPLHCRTKEVWTQTDSPLRLSETQAPPFLPEATLEGGFPCSGSGWCWIINDPTQSSFHTEAKRRRVKAEHFPAVSVPAGQPCSEALFTPPLRIHGCTHVHLSSTHCKEYFSGAYLLSHQVKLELYSRNKGRMDICRHPIVYYRHLLGTFLIPIIWKNSKHLKT